MRLSGTRGRASAELGVRARHLADAHRDDGAVALVTAEGSDPCRERAPTWLDPLYEAAEMRAADALGDRGPGRPAGRPDGARGAGLARVTAAVAAEGPIRIVAGKGNNGGDGRVAARLLAEDGYEVEVIDGTEPFDPERLAGSGAVVDALLGTGFEGAPREPVASAIAAINRAGRAGGGLRRALGRERLDRRGGGGGGAGRRHGDLPRLQGRTLREPGQGARRAR